MRAKLELYKIALWFLSNYVCHQEDDEYCYRPILDYDLLSKIINVGISSRAHHDSAQEHLAATPNLSEK